MVTNRRNRLARDAARVTANALVQRIEMARQRLETFERRQRQSIDRALNGAASASNRPRGWPARYRTSAYSNAASRWCSMPTANLVKRAAEIATGDALPIRFADGEVNAMAADETAPGRSRKPGRSTPTGGQGSLF